MKEGCEGLFEDVDWLVDCVDSCGIEVELLLGMLLWVSPTMMWIIIVYKCNCNSDRVFYEKVCIFDMYGYF